MSSLQSAYAYDFDFYDLDDDMGCNLELDSKEIKPRKKIRWVDVPVYTHTNVTSLVEIYSIRIHSNQINGGGEMCEMYGHVRVIDNLGDTFDIFLRNRDDPECIDSDGTLLLSSPLLDSNEGVNVIIPSEYVSVDVLLFDKAHNDIIIAKGEFALDKVILDCKLEHMCKCVEGDGGFAGVHYAVFPFAVVANVDVLFFSKDEFDLLSDDVKPSVVACGEGVSDDDYDVCENEVNVYDEADYIEYDDRECEDSVANIFGTITARSVDLDPIDCYSSVLFRKSLEQSVQVKSRGFITLSRSVVAVPAYSSLKIEVDLSESDTQLSISRNTVEFTPQDSEIYKKDIVGGNGRIRVRVKWSEAYQQLYKARKLKRSGAYGITLDNENVEEEKRVKLLFAQETSGSVVSSRIPPVLPKLFSQQTPMVEVFSVVVCGKDFKHFDFYGTIKVNSSSVCIFNSDENSPQHCPPGGKQLMFGSNCSFDLVEDFALWANLKNVNDKSEICKGYIMWTPNRLKPWLNKRLCSVVQGDRGFIAVHYSIFKDAVAAVMSIKLYGNTPSSRVSGKLVARYGNHDYSSSYKKKYYQSVIFYKDDDEEEVVLNGSSIPLLKSVIAIRRTYPLEIEAELRVSRVHDEGPQEAESLHGKITFKNSDHGDYSEMQIKGQGVYILVSIKFRQW